MGNKTESSFTAGTNERKLEAQSLLGTLFERVGTVT
jgi:hypothetical protein